MCIELSRRFENARKTNDFIQKVGNLQKITVVLGNVRKAYGVCVFGQFYWTICDFASFLRKTLELCVAKTPGPSSPRCSADCSSGGDRGGGGRCGLVARCGGPAGKG